MAVGFGLSQATGALVGGALGGKRLDEALACAAQPLFLAVATGVVLALAGVVISGPVMKFLGAKPEILLAGENYLKLLFLGLPGCLLGFTANGVLSAQGDMSANRTAQIVAFGANVLLDPLLIYGAFGIPGLGFDGIAISTALIQSCVAIWLVRKALGTRALSGVCIRDFLPGRQIAFALFRQGAPSTFTMMVMMFGGLIMQAHLQPFGAPAVAGAGISLRVEQLILLPILAISFSYGPMVAQNFGAGDYDRLRQATTLAVIVILVMSMTGAVALAIFGAAMMRIFTGDEATVAAGVSYLRAAALMMPAYSMMFLVNALFQGLKRPIWSVLIGLYRQILALAVFPQVFIALGWGLSGIWAGLFVAVWSGFILAMVMAYRIAGDAIGGLRADFRGFGA